MYNCLDILIADLQNHKVMTSWPGHKQVVPCYLIVVTAQAALAESFLTFYGDELTPAQARLAQSELSKTPEATEFGVLLDMDRRMIYAFDRRFASYDNKERAIAVIDPDRVLADLVKPAVTSLDAALDTPFAKPKAPKTTSLSSMSAVFRYAFPELDEAEMKQHEELLRSEGAVLGSF